MTADDVVHSFDRAMTSGTSQAIYSNIAGVAAVGRWK